MEVNNVGKISFSEGEYIGEVEDGKASGFGRMVYHNGDVYLGEWRSNCQTGWGAKSTSGYTAVGNFSNGMRSGKCVVVQKNSEPCYHIGNYSADARCGKGYSINKSGTNIYFGGFDRGVPSGKGYLGEDLGYRDGSLIEGTFVGGSISGQYTRCAKTHFESKGGTFYGDVTDNMKHYFGYGAWVYDKAYATVEFGYHNELNGDRLSYNFRGVKVYRHNGSGVSVEEGDWGTDTKKNGTDFAKIYKDGSLYIGAFSDDKRSGDGAYAVFDGGTLSTLTIRRNGKRYVISKYFEVIARGKFSGDDLYDGTRFYENNEAFLYRGGTRVQSFGVDYPTFSGRLNDGSAKVSYASSGESTVKELAAARLERERREATITEPTHASVSVSESVYQPVAHDYGDGYGEVLTFKQKLQLQLEENKARREAKKGSKKTTEVSAPTALEVITTPKAPKPPKAPSVTNETVQRLNEEYSFRDHRSVLLGVKIKKEVHELPNSVAVIAERAFSMDTTIKEIKGGKSLHSIRAGAFSGCLNLEVADFSNTKLVCVENFAFNECPRLKEVSFPITFTQDIVQLFKGCDGNLLINGKHRLREFIQEKQADDKKDKNDKKDKSADKKAEPIETYEFSKHQAGKNIYVHLVKVNVFSEKMELPAGLCDVMKSAFSGNCVIREISGGLSLGKINDGGFSGCKNLTTVDLTRTSVGSIFKETFKDCVSLENFITPRSLGVIYESAFENCTSLKTLELPAKCIHSNAFKNCTALERVYAPSVFEIERNAFAGCENLVEIVVERKCKIKRGAFPRSLKMKKTKWGDKKYLTFTKKHR